MNFDNIDIIKFDPKTECMVLTYTVETIIKIPKDIDRSKVKEFWFKYDRLHMLMEDDSVETIEPYISATDTFYDYKYPDKVEVTTKDEVCVDDSEDEEDEDDEEDDDNNKH